ncbi:MAG: MtrB/PioB family outer membrane beta-barrel protein [Gammaproteobacteria bacterium]|nr:MtrB/PioB family outer membrane beta-barrel protein [Gammaproteobacteria bacterium]
MNCFFYTSIQATTKFIVAISLIATLHDVYSNDEEKTKLEFTNCEWCHQFSEAQINYFAGLSWLNGDYLQNNRELNYREPFDFLFGYDSRYWNDDLLSTLSIEYLNENNQSLYFSFQNPGKYKFKLYHNSLLWYFGDAQINLYTHYGGDIASLPAGWQPIESTNDLTASNTKFQDFESTTEWLRQGMSFDYTPNTNWRSGLELDSTHYKSQQLQAGSMLTTVTNFPLQRDFTNDQLTAYLAYQKDHWQFKTSYLLSLLKNQYVTTFWENPFITINNNYREIPFTQTPDNKFHQLTLSYVNQLTPSQRLQLNGAWGKGRQDDYLALPFDPILGYDNSLIFSNAHLNVSTSNIRVNYSNRLYRNLRLNYRYQTDNRKTKANQQIKELWSNANGSDYDNFNTIYARNFDYQKQSHQLNFNWRINRYLRLNSNNQWRDYKRVHDSISSEHLKHVVRLNVLAADNYDFSFSAGTSHRKGNINWYYWDASSPLDERNILSRFHANNFNRQEWRMNSNWFINKSNSLAFDYQKQYDRYPNVVEGIMRAKHATSYLGYHHGFNDSLTGSIFMSRELSLSTQLGGIDGETLPWQSQYQDEIVTTGLNLNYLPKSSEWRYKLSLLNGDFSGDQHTQSVLNEEPFPTIKRQQTKVKFEPIYQLNTITKLNMLYQYERLSNRDWQQDLLTIDEVPKLIPSTLIAPEYNLHFIAFTIIVTL